MSPARAIHFHSPGWRECQRHEQNPGYTQTINNMSSIGAALTARVGHLLLGCAAPTGLKKSISMPNPGLAPWARQEYRPVGALR